MASPSGRKRSPGNAAKGQETHTTNRKAFLAHNELKQIPGHISPTTSLPSDPLPCLNV